MFLNSENYLYQVRQLVGSSQYLDLAPGVRIVVA
jgi:hypothetical protein